MDACSQCPEIFTHIHSGMADKYEGLNNVRPEMDEPQEHANQLPASESHMNAFYCSEELHVAQQVFECDSECIPDSEPQADKCHGSCHQGECECNNSSGLYFKGSSLSVSACTCLFF